MQKYSQARFSFLAVIPLVILLTACGGAVSQGGFNDPSGGSGNSLAITTSSLPAGQAQTAYQTTLAASGGTTPYSWQVASGQLPPGLSLNATTGEISGTPSTTGQFNFTAEVTDSSQPSSQVATRALMIDITAPSGPAVTVSPILVSVQIGGSQQFSATVTGPANTAVDWLVDNVQGGNSTVGTISTGGLYTAPANLPNPVTVTVTAVSAADSSLSANATVTVVDASPSPGLDIYGGCAVCGITGQVTGFFHLEKINGRWWFIDPLGNPFWMRSVYNVASGGHDAVLLPKYGSLPTWGTQIVRRLKSWGFNALGEFTSTSAAIPIGSWGSTSGNPEKMPFIMLLGVTLDAVRNPSAGSCNIPEAVKDIIAGVPTGTYNSFRAPLVDAYDPKFQQCAENSVNYWNQVITGGFADKDWIIGITPDDADDLYGFKSRGDAPVAEYPHPAFLIATSNHTYSGFSDPELHSKTAWINFIQQKYNNDINALNIVWQTGGFYTSFDTSGGYGVGTGVIDEDGRHGWMGTDAWMLTSATPGLISDLDAFLYEFAKKYATVLTDAIRAVDTNHLIFGPASLNNYGAKARDEVLLGLADGGVDVFQFNYDPRTGDMTENNLSYDLTGKPVYIWYSVNSNSDSAMSSTPPPWQAPDFPSQNDRGVNYEMVDIPAFVNARGANGDFYVVGFDWWDLWDSAREGTNWGLVTLNDNAYDGREAVQAPGTDPWGFPTGGEAADYGDFLTRATRANKSILCLIGVRTTCN